MKRTLRGVLLLFLLGCFCIALRAQGADQKPLDAMVDKALAGYNAGDSKAFYADYAKMMAAVATDATFNMLYKGMYLKNYGKYVSRQPIQPETVMADETPLLVYQGEFEKNKKVKISVNFIKEDGAYKVMQIQFAPM